MALDIGADANEDFDVKFLEDQATRRWLESFVRWAGDVNRCREVELNSVFLLFGRPLPGRSGSDELPKELSVPEMKYRHAARKFHWRVGVFGSREVFS